MKFLNIALLFFVSLPLFAKPLPQKLVVLSPALFEIIFSLGEGKRIIGATEYSDYPRQAKPIPRVGSYASPSIEKIVELKPEAVLLADEGVDTVTESLARAGIKTRIYKMKTLRDFETVVTQLGKELSVEKKADAVLTNWKNDWKKLESEKSQHRVLIQVDHDPIFVAGDKTFLSEIIDRCGSSNDMSSLNGYKQPTLERLAQTKADTILVTAQIKAKDLKENILAFWEKQPLNSKPRILFADPDQLSRLAPRLPLAALKICKDLKATP